MDWDDAQQQQEQGPQWVPLQPEGQATPLHHAAAAGDAPLVQHLLATTADAAQAVAAEDDVEQTPLHLAAAGGHASVVRLLLEASPEAALLPDAFNNTPLHRALDDVRDVGQAAAVVQLLLEAAPDAVLAPNGTEGADDLPIHCAARSGLTALALQLLEAAPRTVAASNSWGSPLRVAVEHGHHSTARALLDFAPAAGHSLRALAAAITAAHDSAPYRDLLGWFLRAPGRLPLPPAAWAQVPIPCPGMEHVLPLMLPCPRSEALQALRRCHPTERARLRCALLCMNQLYQHCGIPPLPGDLEVLILAQSLSSSADLL